MAILIPLLLLTLFMIGAYAAVLTRHSRSILLLGMVLLPIMIFAFVGLFLEFNLIRAIIILIFLITGIIFIIWSGTMDDDDSNPGKDTSIKKRQKYKYLLYSAIVFCIAGFSVGMFSKKFVFYEDAMLLIMICILFAGISQFVIYYILCKIRDFRAKKTNCLDKTGTENP